MEIKNWELFDNFGNPEKLINLFGEAAANMMKSWLSKDRRLKDNITHLAIVEVKPNNVSETMVYMPLCPLEGVLEDFSDDMATSMKNHIELVSQSHVFEIIVVEVPDSSNNILSIIYYTDKEKKVTIEFGKKYLDLYLEMLDANIKGSFLATEMINKKEAIEKGVEYDDSEVVEKYLLTNDEKDKIKSKYIDIIDYLNTNDEIIVDICNRHKLSDLKFVQFEFSTGAIYEYSKLRPEGERLTLAKADISSITPDDLDYLLDVIKTDMDKLRLLMIRMSKNSAYIKVEV
ncbi:MAG: hypothetical protein ACRCZ9_11285 [Fusobacteriaceae bacterium]